MQRKILIGIAVILLGVVAGWYYLGNEPINLVPSSVNPSPTPVVSEIGATPELHEQVATSTVTLIDNGFNPATLTVRAGTTVRFTNQSSGEMWIASNPHLTHSLLPGFDELKSVKKGGFYDYQFVQVGTWIYHNHVAPTVIGTVMVTE